MVINLFVFAVLLFLHCYTMMLSAGFVIVNLLAKNFAYITSLTNHTVNKNVDIQKLL